MNDTLREGHLYITNLFFLRFALVGTEKR